MGIWGLAPLFESSAPEVCFQRATQCPECGNGSCNEGVTGDGWCTCVSDVYGPNCGSQCAGGKSNPCNGHGSGDEGATGPGVCTCATSYVASDCTGECLPCAANPCNGHGTCNDADGTCTCDPGYFGAPCGNECPGGAGAGACNGNGQCSDGAGGSGSCSCDPGYYDTDCGNECPGGASNPWSGHDRCSEVHGTCTCQASGAGHWTGSDCSAFASGYYGPSCTQCPECGDGSCNEGVTGDGWCTCVSDVYGPNCGIQCAGGKSNSCNGHGSGDEGATGTGSCTCSSRYFGLPCSEEYSPSSSHPCSGHGVVRSVYQEMVPAPVPFAAFYD